jgi:exopolyphosphatase/guanosine-5'-triphosphate,3'-diphosphate pyrophosphatase
MIVFDIGGGSTEIVWLHQAGRAAHPRLEILGSVSLPFGVVTFTERFGGIEVTPASYRAMVAGPRPRWRRSRRSTASGARCAPARQMLGSSGTVTTLAGVNLPCRATSGRWSTAAC